MRSVDLAVYADSIAAEAAALCARLERARRRLRQAAIEREARLALPADAVCRLERLDLLRPSPAGEGASEISELQSTLAAVERLQAWVEERLEASVRGQPLRRWERASGQATASRSPLAAPASRSAR
jgi:hypothetical protein